MTGRSYNLKEIAGLVLAGGRSSRFGADKALARFRGELLLDRARRPLGDLPLVAISARVDSAISVQARERGLPVVTDNPGEPAGPLAGILAGFDWAQAHGFPLMLSVPCDAPLLPLDLASTLLAKRGQAKVAFAETREGAHPLCALWRTDLSSSLRAALTSGRHPPVRTYQADIGAAAVWFDNTHAFANANTRALLNDLERGL